MKTIIFVILIIASASYLALGNKSPLTMSEDGQTVSIDIDQVQSDFAKQLASLKDEMLKNQQRQIEALQQSVVNLAQKTAKLEEKVAQLQAMPAVETRSEQQYAQPEQMITTSTTGPDVGAIAKPVDYDNFDGDVNGVDNSQAVAVVNDESSDTAMMNKQQRRKRLQNLSERMTLKSLGVEK